MPWILLHVNNHVENHEVLEKKRLVLLNGFNWNSSCAQKHVNYVKNILTLSFYLLLLCINYNAICIIDFAICIMIITKHKF